MDAEFQKALDSARRLLNEELDKFYFSKEYLGDYKMQREAKARDNADRQKKFEEKMAEYKMKYDALHFPDGGRASYLKNIELEEKKQRYEQNLNEHFEKSARSKDNDRGR